MLRSLLDIEFDVRIMMEVLMETSLTLDLSHAEAAKMQDAIARCIAEIDELRTEMRRDEEAIEKSSLRTDAILTDIAQTLAEMRAA